MAAEELSAEFISIQENLVEIYTLIVEAANNTSPPDESDRKILVEFNKSDKNRFSLKNTRSNTAKPIAITYEPANICITGGSALNIYDLALENYRKRKAITPLKEFVNRSTPDIDIVWWPTIKGTTTHAIISESPIIHNFVLRLEKQLNTTFSTLIGKSYTIFGKSHTVNGIYITNNFLTNDRRPAGYLYGTHQLKISIQLNNTIIHIVDFSIYDSASGQTKSSQPLLPMNMDPVYMNKNNIKQLKIDNIVINVPEIKHLIRQQIFAFTNIFPINPIKGQIIYKRILYIKELISKADSRNNIRNITRVFGNIGNLPIKSITDTLNKNSIDSLQNVSTMIEEDIQKNMSTVKVTPKPVQTPVTIQTLVHTPETKINRDDVIIKRLRDLDIEYNKQRLIIEEPIRQAKRRGQNTRRIKAYIEDKLAQLDYMYNKKKKEIQGFVNNSITPRQSMQSSKPLPIILLNQPTTHLKIMREYYNNVEQLIGFIYDEYLRTQYESVIEILPNGQRRIRIDIPMFIRYYKDTRGLDNEIYYVTQYNYYINRVINPYTGQIAEYKLSPTQYAKIVQLSRK